MSAKERLENEINELGDRCEALDRYLNNSQALGELSVVQQELLSIQLSVMETYLHILQTRQKHWGIG